MFNSVCGTFHGGKDQITEGGSPVLYVDYKELSDRLQEKCDRLEQDASRYYWAEYAKDCELKSARLAEEKAKDDLKDQYVRNGNLMEENSDLKVEIVIYQEQVELELFNQEQINKHAEGLTEENCYLWMQIHDLKQKNAFLEESMRLMLAEQKEETKGLRDKIDSLTEFVLDWA